MNVLGDAWDWLADGANWSGESGVWNRLTEHIVLTVVCVLIAVAIALPFALWLGHLGKGGALAINISNIGRAIPTFAVLVLLGLSPIGMGDTATIIALVLFAIPPVLTNAYVGMRQVDRDVVEASRGMGMTGGQMLFRVELPLALPLIMTGIRMCAVQVVATATLAALVAGAVSGASSRPVSTCRTTAKWWRGRSSWPRWLWWWRACSRSCSGSRPGSRVAV